MFYGLDYAGNNQVIITQYVVSLLLGTLNQAFFAKFDNLLIKIILRQTVLKSSCCGMGVTILMWSR